ncbi:proto-oncogene c-Fos-like [Haliotis rubra]|uniref:proto-oncogene c-Fos-like n=1 Tax=Haliotis rubra TaxID=36100 RepID=UPI001EE50492|nr:proto-oncogene c-Fos-like [Haliotis rubra]
MVRVVCQNFQRPRSRHTSGESPYSVDSDLARRAAEALTTMTAAEGRKFDSDTETSSDACWESDGGTCWDAGTSDSGAEPPKDKDALLKKRKARRRERNKVSAQAYRQRRKEQTLSQQKILTQLEDHKKELLEQIEKLQKEKCQVETFLRSCFTRQEPAPQASSSMDTMAHHFHNNHRHHENLCRSSNIPAIMSVS